MRLLIAAWGNVGHVGLNTIAASPHVKGAPERGRADAIGPWLKANGMPAANVFSLALCGESPIASPD